MHKTYTAARVLAAVCLLCFAASATGTAQQIAQRELPADRYRLLDRAAPIELDPPARELMLRPQPPTDRGLLQYRERMPTRDLLTDRERQFEPYAPRRRELLPYDEVLANQEQLLAARDGDWISISGVVQAVGFNQFWLQVGEAMLSVEVDDLRVFHRQPLAPGGRTLQAGDLVTVNGRFDREFGDAGRIEARSFYVARTGRHYSARPADDVRAMTIATSSRRAASAA